MVSENEVEVSSYEELVAREAEILHRIDRKPNGGRLLILNPLRLLEEVGVKLSDRAIAEWGSAAGERLFETSGHEAAYDAVAASDPSAGGVTIRVSGLFMSRSR